MFSRIDIEERLKTGRNTRISPDTLLQEVYSVLEKNDHKHEEIREKLSLSAGSHNNTFNLSLLESERIFHLSDIQKICVDYRLRFLDSKYFKGEFPEEAISEIRRIEAQHGTSISRFKIMAPAKLLKLENADDPLLFADLGNDYFYLIHKWGRDLHPLRKLMMWPFRRVGNMVLTIFAFSALLTAIFPMHWFSENPSVGEYFFFFLFTVKSVAGLTVLYGGSKGKNFNEVIWNSKYYNA